MYKHAVTNMLTSTLDVMARNNLKADDVAYLIPHKANLRIIEAVADRAQFPMEKVLVNIEHTGNTSAASIPICLDEFRDKLKKGDKLILTAFGAVSHGVRCTSSGIFNSGCLRLKYTEIASFGVLFLFIWR